MSSLLKSQGYDDNKNSRLSGWWQGSQAPGRARKNDGISVLRDEPKTKNPLKPGPVKDKYPASSQKYCDFITAIIEAKDGNFPKSLKRSSTFQFHGKTISSIRPDHPFSDFNHLLSSFVFLLTQWNVSFTKNNNATLYQTMNGRTAGSSRWVHISRAYPARIYITEWSRFTWRELPVTLDSRPCETLPFHHHRHVKAQKLVRTWSGANSVGCGTKVKQTEKWRRGERGLANIRHAPTRN